jgi:hypothetical protein
MRQLTPARLLCVDIDSVEFAPFPRGTSSHHKHQRWRLRRRLRSPRSPNGENSARAPSLETTAFVAPTPPVRGPRSKKTSRGRRKSFPSLMHVNTNRRLPQILRFNGLGGPQHPRRKRTAHAAIGTWNLAHLLSDAPRYRPGHRNCGDPIHTLEGQAQGRRLTVLIEPVPRKIVARALKSRIIK